MNGCDTKEVSLVGAEVAAVEKRLVTIPTLTGARTLVLANVPAEENFSLIDSGPAETRIASTSADAWDTLSSTEEEASSASTEDTERWSVSAIQAAQSLRPGIRQADRLFLKYLSSREMKKPLTLTRATAKILTQPFKESAVNRLLNILRRWRLRQLPATMEVAVSQEGLLRLRPIVHCDRGCREWST